MFIRGDEMNFNVSFHNMITNEMTPNVNMLRFRVRNRIVRYGNRTVDSSVLETRLNLATRGLVQYQFLTRDLSSCNSSEEK